MSTYAKPKRYWHPDESGAFILITRNSNGQSRQCAVVRRDSSGWIYQAGPLTGRAGSCAEAMAAAESSLR